MDKKTLTYFSGSLEDWCKFVNDNHIAQEQISMCQFLDTNGSWIVCCTYWT